MSHAALHSRRTRLGISTEFPEGNRGESVQSRRPGSASLLKIREESACLPASQAVCELIQISASAARAAHTASMHETPLFNADLLRRYDRPGPRYTSYPTAPNFGPHFDETMLREYI